MRTLVRMAAVAACSIAAVPGVGSAAPKVAATQVTITGADASGVTGVVTSATKQCAEDRVITFANAATGVVFRTVRTPRKSGAFSLPLSAIPPGVQTVLVTATATTTGVRCAADSLTISFDHASLSGGAAGQQFQGTLTTDVAACRANRRVEVFEISSGEPQFVGWNVTDANGMWTLQAASGTYYASVDRTLRGSGDAFAYCNGAVSNSWSYEEPFPPEE